MLLVLPALLLVAWQWLVHDERLKEPFLVDPSRSQCPQGLLVAQHQIRPIHLAQEGTWRRRGRR